MDHWNVFDANCLVGRHQKLQEGGLHTTAHLLEEMDHYGIAEALVLDPLARENHTADGNARVLQQTAGQPRLHPVWSALPAGATDEQPDPAQFLADMRRRGVAALALFPRQYRFELSDWCIDDLLAPLAEAGVPVFINYTKCPGSGWRRTRPTECRGGPGRGHRPSCHRQRNRIRSQRVVYRPWTPVESDPRAELTGSTATSTSRPAGAATGCSSAQGGRTWGPIYPGHTDHGRDRGRFKRAPAGDVCAAC